MRSAVSSSTWRARKVDPVAGMVAERNIPTTCRLRANYLFRLPGHVTESHLDRLLTTSHSVRAHHPRPSSGTELALAQTS